MEANNIHLFPVRRFSFSTDSTTKRTYLTIYHSHFTAIKLISLSIEAIIKPLIDITKQGVLT